jgi:hypothetical protein
MTQEPDLVCVQSVQGLDVAEIYKSKLEAMGIPVLLRYDSAARLFGLTVDGLGEVRLLVPEPFAAQAEALLAEPVDGEGTGDTDDRTDGESDSAP